MDAAALRKDGPRRRIEKARTGACPYLASVLTRGRRRCSGGKGRVRGRGTAGGERHAGHVGHAGEGGRDGSAVGAWGREGRESGGGGAEGGDSVGGHGGWDTSWAWEGRGRHAATGGTGHCRWSAGREVTRRRRHDAKRRRTTWETGKRRRSMETRLVLRQHRVGVGLAFSGVGRGNGVDDRLSLLMSNLLVIIHHVAKMVPPAIMSLPHAQRVVREIDVAIITKEFRHGAGV